MLTIFSTFWLFQTTANFDIQLRNVELLVDGQVVTSDFGAPFDLSMSYGHRDGADHDNVRAAIARVEEVLLPAPVHVGGLALDAPNARALIARGYRLIVTGFDVLFLQRAAGEILDGIRGGG